MPFTMSVLSQNLLLTLTDMDRLCIKLLIKLNILPLMTLLSSLVNKPWRPTLSKVFSMTTKMVHTFFFYCSEGFVD